MKNDTGQKTDTKGKLTEFNKLPMAERVKIITQFIEEERKKGRDWTDPNFKN